jgi:hypothetical protein
VFYHGIQHRKVHWLWTDLWSDLKLKVLTCLHIWCLRCIKICCKSKAVLASSTTSALDNNRPNHSVKPLKISNWGLRVGSEQTDSDRFFLVSPVIRILWPLKCYHYRKVFSSFSGMFGCNILTIYGAHIWYSVYCKYILRILANIQTLYILSI